MSSKNKLNKFRENETFQCLIQPQTAELMNTAHPLKGKWNSDFFKNDYPIVLELGCGKGEYTIALAEKYPNKNYIGIDIKGARLWKGAKYATQQQLSNVGFIRTRIEFITSLFAAEEISEIWLTFSDPQITKPKKRLTSHIFLSRYAQFLKTDGLIHLKTDSQLLHESTLEVIEEGKHRLIVANNDIYGTEFHLTNEILSVKTFYESIFLAKGMPITYLEFML